MPANPPIAMTSQRASSLPVPPPNALPAPQVQASQDPGTSCLK